MKLSNAFGYALLGTCLYGAVMNSFPTNEEKDAVGEVDATNEVERAGCAAAYENVKWKMENVKLKAEDDDGRWCA